MKSIIIATVATAAALATAGCSQTATTSGTSATPSASATPDVSQSPSPSKSATTSQTNSTASQIAATLGCDNIATQTPVGTTPKATTMAKCTLGDQGYHVLVYSNSAATTAAIASLKAQATGSGETITIAKSTTWIVKAAEGPTIGTTMVKAAQSNGGSKVVLS